MIEIHSCIHQIVTIELTLILHLYKTVLKRNISNFINNIISVLPAWFHLIDPELHFFVIHVDPELHFFAIHVDPELHFFAIHVDPELHFFVIHVDPELHFFVIHVDPELHFFAIHNVEMSENEYDSEEGGHGSDVVPIQLFNGLTHVQAYLPNGHIEEDSAAPMDDGDVRLFSSQSKN
ncbi:hypothetical protein KUTeg_004185 [Tegillarca granosa]|uniref:Uncharacterized protein n=1 Tax=Tegillarca granosa TaxID=220873 RepID=A0ABQ9FP93_TEGGR|nr:hypothetical protein KUTeg_004185 [Tegillarca granosa]